MSKAEELMEALTFYEDPEEGPSQMAICIRVCDILGITREMVAEVDAALCAFRYRGVAAPDTRPAVAALTTLLEVAGR